MMLDSIFKSDFVKLFCLIAVMAMLGFNVCVYFMGWPYVKPVLLMPHHERPPNRRLGRSRFNASSDQMSPWFTMNATNLLMMELNVTTMLPPPMPCASCKKPQCLDCLQSQDMKFYESCLTNTRFVFKKVFKSALQGSCGFIDGRTRAAVGLVSFRGSGDVWVRELLEAATGICTGAIYCDAAVRRSGMNGEGVHSGAVLVTNTHFFSNVTWTEPDEPASVYLPNHSTSKHHPAYGSAILLVRNPFDALVAEYTTKYVHKNQPKKLSHVMHMTERSKFGKNLNWDKFIKYYLKWWHEYFPVWLVNGTKYDHPVHVVKMEELKSNTLLEVQKMLNFLGFPYDVKDLTKRLRDRTSEEREHNDDDFNHFTRNQRQLINDTISNTIAFLRTNYTSTLGLENYLWHD